MIPHLLIHVFGHTITCILLGGQFDGFEFVEFNITSFSLGCRCYCKDANKIAIIASAGSLTIIIFISIIAQLKKSYFITYLQFLSVIVDGIYWVMGGYLPTSDVIIFCKALDLDAKIFGLYLIPLLISVIYLLFRRMNKQLDKYIE